MVTYICFNSWQSVFSRLAGYEDTNDAERLSVDPAMRQVVGGRAVDHKAASTSQMGRCENWPANLIKECLSDFGTIGREIAGKQRGQSLWRRVPRWCWSRTGLTRGRRPVELDLEMKGFPKLARIAAYLVNPGIGEVDLDSE